MYSILIIGCGSIGRRHAAILCELGCRVEVYDPADHLGNAPSSPYSQVTYSALSASDRWDGYLIASPNHTHAEYLRMLIPRAKKILVEKPVVIDLSDRDLIAMILAADRSILAGYNLLHRPEYCFIKEFIDSGKAGRIIHGRINCASFLPRWRTADYRSCYSAHRDQGGGVLFDAIHEIDYIRDLFGRPSRVWGVSGKLSDLEIDSEDFADLFLECPGPVRVNLHLDYFQHRYNRSLELAATDCGLVWSFKQKQVIVCSSDGDEAIYSFDEFDDQEMYRREARHFLEMIGHDTPARVSAGEGLQDVAVVEAVRKMPDSYGTRPILYPDEISGRFDG